LKYYFHPAAEIEYLENIAYYESKLKGLGGRYLDEFEGLLKNITHYPQRNPIELQPDIRRKRMKNYPFTILYREASNQIQVLAIAHFRRKPHYWAERL